MIELVHDSERWWHPNNGRIVFVGRCPCPVLWGVLFLEFIVLNKPCGSRKHFARNKRQYGSSTDGSNMTGRFWVSALCRQAAESLSPLPKQHVCLSFRRTKLAESEAISPSPRHLDCMTFTLCILHLFPMCHNFCSNAFELILLPSCQGVKSWKNHGDIQAWNRTFALDGESWPPR